MKQRRQNKFGGTMEQHVRFIRDFCVALALVCAFVYFLR